MSFTGATAITAVSAVWKFTRGDTTKFGWTTKLAVTISSASTNSTGSKRSSQTFSPKKGDLRRHWVYYVKCIIKFHHS